MRIGLIIYGSLDTKTGGYLYDRIVARGLARLGHEVEVISLPGGSYLGRLGHGLSSGLCRRLLAGDFDVLVQDELCHPSLFLVNFRLRRLRRRGGPLLIALIHHVLCREPRSGWQNWLLAIAERRYLASVDGYIHNSATTRRTVAGLAEGRRPEVVAYPAGDRFGNPLSPETIGRRVCRPGPLELLFLGMVIPRKGLLPLLRALARVDRDLWRLSVVGSLDFDPGHVTEARRLVKDLELSTSVLFLGHRPDDELVQVLTASHLFCMPYAYEGFGIAILEAMAFGLPAIGCRTGAASETISHGTNGFLLDPADLDGLAPLLAKLHRDREELRRMSFAASATYAGRPTWQESATTIDGFLQRVTGWHSRGRAADTGRGAPSHAAR
jgi:glycosyltransferase involved in cell wall biosynthesis